ncbi:MAG: GntR family transcriptional regulator [Eubacterium sp.]|nr:GntR family transcriptional regulator [Eubacterium sp.]
MISFEEFKKNDRIPIYLQILLYVKRGILSGGIQRGDVLPSRRMLSALLGVNPNTVQKAYRMLEEEGLILSHSGAKSMIEFDEESIRKIRRELLEEDMQRIISDWKQMGLRKEEVLEMMGELWEKEDWENER